MAVQICLLQQALSSIYFKAVLLCPLCSLPTPMVLLLTGKCHEGSEQRWQWEYQGGSLSLLLTCLSHQNAPSMKKKALFAHQLHAPGVHPQECLVHRHCAIITVIIFNCLLRETLCSPTLQNSTVPWLLIFSTGWTRSHVVTHTAFGFRQLFC